MVNRAYLPVEIFNVIRMPLCADAIVSGRPCVRTIYAILPVTETSVALDLDEKRIVYDDIRYSIWFICSALILRHSGRSESVLVLHGRHVVTMIFVGLTYGNGA